MVVIQVLPCAIHLYLAKENKYIEKYGKHFNEKLCNFAVSLMTRDGNSIVPLSKDAVDKLLLNNKIILDHNKCWDYIFVANMGKADYLGSSIPDDHHLALYIKDTIDDEDIGEGTAFSRWCATMKDLKIEIKWDEYM